MRILIIEDDEVLGATLRDLLALNYTIDLVKTGREGLHKAKSLPYDLILLDLGLPDVTGKEVCKQLRKEKITAPILIITGRSQVAEKVICLDNGADDYLIKPFNFIELSARVRALLRRNQPSKSSSVLQCEDLILDTTTRTVTRNEQRIQLRRKEFDLLEYLLRNQGHVLTRSMILDHVWDENCNPFSNIVDVHIKYLRDRVEKPFKSHMIKTVHGIGYTINPLQKKEL